MAKLLHVDTFDHYTPNVNLLDKWTNVLGGSDANLVGLVAGRTLYGIQFNVVSAPVVTLEDDHKTFCCGLAYKTDGYANAVLTFRNISKIVNTVGFTPSPLRIDLQHVGNGRLEVVFGQGGPQPSPPTQVPGVVLKQNRFYHVGLRCTPVLGVGDFAGFLLYYFDVWINGGLRMSSFYSAPSNISDPDYAKWCTLETGAPGGGASAVIDDFWLTDGPWLGDSRWYVIRPDGDTAVSGWSPSVSGMAHFLMKNKLIPGGSGYLAASGIGDKELEDLEPLTGRGQIVGAQGVWRLEKSEAGEAVVDLLYDVDGTEYFAKQVYPGFGSQLYFLDGQIVNPVTSGAWTQATIDDLKQGEERSG